MANRASRRRSCLRLLLWFLSNPRVSGSPHAEGYHGSEKGKQQYWGLAIYPAADLQFCPSRIRPTDRDDKPLDMRGPARPLPSELSRLGPHHFLPSEVVR